MSLLIKALEQAAESKNAGDKVELSLEPLAATSEGASKDASATPKYSQKAASTVFSAKTSAQPKPSSKLAWFALAALILVLIAVGYFYWYWQSLAAPELVVARPPAVQNAPPTQVTATSQNNVNVNTETSNSAASDNASPPQSQPEAASAATENKVDTTLPAESVAKVEPSLVMTSSKQKKKIAVPSMPLTEQDLSKPVRRANVSKSLVFGEPVPSAEDGSVKVVKNQPTVGINPKLIEAYNAYTKGDDVQAQQAYREVLKGDVRNTDAILGMATIAARQGRNDDAIGWYKKALEVEPRNHVAQAGIVSLQQQDDPVSAETRFKNMIAQQPESASLYAALGDLYVSQNQWPSAQQAYFQAYHFEPNNAQHVFNLAVSLDHMGKPNLALPYYQRALELVSASGATSIDRAKLESRISQLSQ
ncbi:MAG TPA: tetratricopeptide repeat protein [Methylophilaceae bacterium]|jgi:tetratricopeptide (TPR) repeat protein